MLTVTPLAERVLEEGPSRLESFETNLRHLDWNRAALALAVFGMSWLFGHEGITATS